MKSEVFDFGDSNLIIEKDGYDCIPLTNVKWQLCVSKFANKCVLWLVIPDQLVDIQYRVDHDNDFEDMFETIEVKDCAIDVSVKNIELSHPDKFELNLDLERLERDHHGKWTGYFSRD